MVVVCAVPTCPRKKVTTNVSTRSQSIQFHRFPLKRNELLKKWLTAMKAPDFRPTMNTYLCSTHFKESDYELKGSQKQLKPNAVPSVFIQKPNKRTKKETVRQKVESEDSDAASKTDEVEYGEIEKLEDEEVEYILEDELTDGDVSLSLNSNENGQKIIEVQSQLSGLLGSQGKNAPLLLIIGENGEIKNSDFIFKKENEDEVEDQKPDIETLENFEEFNNEILVDNDNEVSELNNFSEPVTKIVQIPQTVSNEENNEVKILEEKLALSRKKVKRLHNRCTKMEKRVKELKVLLKMLILKRGKGVKNLSQLFDEYSKNNDTEPVY